MSHNRAIKRGEIKILNYILNAPNKCNKKWHSPMLEAPLFNILCFCKKLFAQFYLFTRIIILHVLMAMHYVFNIYIYIYWKQKQWAFIVLIQCHKLVRTLDNDNVRKLLHSNFLKSLSHYIIDEFLAFLFPIFFSTSLIDCSIVVYWTLFCVNCKKRETKEKREKKTVVYCDTQRHRLLWKKTLLANTHVLMKKQKTDVYFLLAITYFTTHF